MENAIFEEILMNYINGNLKSSYQAYKELDKTASFWLWVLEASTKSTFEGMIKYFSGKENE